MIPVYTKHLYNIYTTSAQCLRRWSNMVYWERFLLHIDYAVEAICVSYEAIARRGWLTVKPYSDITRLPGWRLRDL